MSGVISAAMKHMIAAGMQPKAILKAVEDIEWAMMYAEHPDVVAAEQRREKDRERKRHSEGPTEVSTEVPIISLDINSEGGVGETKTEIPRNSTPREALSEVLDAEHAAAVIEHRQRLRKSLTPRAAKLLANELKKAPDPNAAADLMIARGWVGFDVAWLKNGKDPPIDKVLAFKPRGPVKTWAEIQAARKEQT
jgi:hypothetical protein